MLTQRDYGDRKNRKHARLKYTLDDHGIDWFREQVEARTGFPLGVARPFEFTSNGDSYGWHLDVNDTWSYGMLLENGRIRDTDSYKLMSGLQELASLDIADFRLTANQNLIIGNVSHASKPAVEALLKRVRYRQRATLASTAKCNGVCCTTNVRSCDGRKRAIFALSRDKN